MTATPRLIVATRNQDKLREIREILSEFGNLEVLDPDAAGIPESDEEEQLESSDTFAANAAAKASFFAAKTGARTLADDSGLCVDALGGAPGVHSRRFASIASARGSDQDAANNTLLLERMAHVPDEQRTGRYVCAVAVAEPGCTPTVYIGECAGVILWKFEGEGGFGYDPLFYIPSERMSFGRLPAARKNAISHRSVAVRAAADAILRG